MDDALSDNPDCPGCQARDEIIAELRAIVEKQSAQIEAATRRIDELEGKVAKLEARLDKDSTNSSKPPSSDGPAERAERDGGADSDRSQGAQPGHDGHHRGDVPEDEVDEVVDVKPEECRGCGHGLCGSDPSPTPHQVTDVVVKKHVCEYRQHALECPECATSTEAKMPDEVPATQFGPTIAAMVTYLTGALNVSKRDAEGAAEEMFGVEMSLGTVSNLEGRLAAGLKRPYDRVRGWLTESERVHIDETTWWVNHDQHWLWALTDCEAVAYRIDPSRGGQVARQMLGGQPAGEVVSDRHTGYNWIEAERRYLCWAHLYRNFKRWKLEDGIVGDVGALLVAETRKLFGWLERIRDDTVGEAEWRPVLDKIRRHVTAYLWAGAKLADEAARFTGLLKLDEPMWAFVDADDWPLTNNEAERAIRPAVLWRDRSFGTQSERGNRFVERMLTAVETLKRQGRRAMGYLEDTWRHLLGREPRPELLPT